jgi:hypothetical protein
VFSKNDPRNMRIDSALYWNNLITQLTKRLGHQGLGAYILQQKKVIKLIGQPMSFLYARIPQVSRRACGATNNKTQTLFGKS